MQPDRCISTLVGLGALLVACADQREEPKVTVWRVLPSAPGSLFTQLGSSALAENELQARGIEPSNKRCAQDSYLRNGQLVLFAEGIAPQYVLFDIPQSHLPAALAIQAGLYLQATSVTDELFQLPFYRCEDRGY